MALLGEFGPGQSRMGGQAGQGNQEAPNIATGYGCSLPCPQKHVGPVTVLSPLLVGDHEDTRTPAGSGRMTASLPGGDGTAPDLVLPWAVELEAKEVVDRLSWARKRGFPQYLWPDVPPTAWRQALWKVQEAVQEVLRSGHPSLAARNEVEARALGVAGYTSGLGPLLGHWIETGQIRPDPLVQRLFSLHLAHGRERFVRLQSEFRRAVGAFAYAGIEPLVVKASHTGVEYFPEPGTRPAIDVDLIVLPEQFVLAERSLEGAGYVLGAREITPRKSTWLAPGASRLPRSFEILHAESQYAVDLHDSLERNFFGVRRVSPLPLEDLKKVPTASLGAPAGVLGHPELLMYHALHASEGLYNLTLIRILELVLMIRRDAGNGSLDWSELRNLLEERDAGRFVYPALVLAEKLAPGTVDSETLTMTESSATTRMRRVLARVEPADAQRLEGISLEDRFMWCATPGDHARRFLHMLVPAPAGRSLRWLGRNYWERLYRVFRRTVSWRDSGSSPFK